MSIRSLKKFYTAVDASSFVVCDRAPTFATPDEETISLAYKSPESSKSDLTSTKQAKRVRFWDDSGLTGFRSKFVYPHLKDRSVQWMDRGWTTRFIVRLWQARYRGCPYKVREEEMHVWFSLCQDCGWDAWWFLNVMRDVRQQRRYAAIPDFSTFSFR